MLMLKAVVLGWTSDLGCPWSRDHPQAPWSPGALACVQFQSTSSVLHYEEQFHFWTNTNTTMMQSKIVNMKAIDMD